MLRRVVEGILYRINKNYHRCIFISDIPDNINPRTVYIVGEANQKWLAIVNCPCGCKEPLHLNLVKTHKPNWNYTLDWKGSISFSPSLWRKSQCKSHFYLKKGIIKWV